MENKYLDLFLTFFKLGLITFGGGYAMIANMKEEIVDKKQWVTDDELMEMIAIAEATPGAVAINMSTYVGYKKGGFLGALCSTIGAFLPSLIIIFIISLFFDKVIGNKYVAYAFIGIKCGVAILIIRAALKLFKNIKHSWWQILLFVLTSITMIVLDIFSVNFSSIFLILIGAALGLIFNCTFNLIAKKKQAKENVEIVNDDTTTKEDTIVEEKEDSTDKKESGDEQ